MLIRILRKLYVELFCTRYMIYRWGDSRLSKLNNLKWRMVFGSYNGNWALLRLNSTEPYRRPLMRRRYKRKI